MMSSSLLLSGPPRKLYGAGGDTAAQPRGRLSRRRFKSPKNICQRYSQVAFGAHADVPLNKRSSHHSSSKEIQALSIDAGWAGDILHRRVQCLGVWVAPIYDFRGWRPTKSSAKISDKGLVAHVKHRLDVWVFVYPPYLYANLVTLVVTSKYIWEPAAIDKCASPLNATKTHAPGKESWSRR